MGAFNREDNDTVGEDEDEDRNKRQEGLLLRTPEV